MRFHNTFVRGVNITSVPDAELEELARLLASEATEVLLTAQGVRQGLRRLSVAKSAAVALARRNIRSLLAKRSSVPDILGALKVALTGAPRDAEDALDDAGLEQNLRFCIFSSPDAVIRLENNDLVISDENFASLRIPRQELREEGAKYFASEALARLVSIEVNAVRFSPSGVLPLALQREMGALMEPDTARERLHKGDWRSTRKPHFQKEYCITCARCFIHCPDNAIVHAMFDKNAKDTTGVLGIDYDRCTACGICASVCPTDRNGYKAIVMISASAEGSPEVHHVG